ncbi:MAG: GNAT family N-acetyltransferase [Acetobacteraceae bacterium]
MPARATISIRRMAAEDLPSVQQLLSQLGYDVRATEVERRYLAVTRAEAHLALVAERNVRVAAFLHVFGRPAFEKAPEAVVQALVVDLAYRGEGIGKTLMAAAEAWALERDFASVALSSSVSRIEAHAFYRALGYQRKATSLLLRKQLQS